ncbi:MAG: error-prone DNA polymerase [Alphaproteobacteria bacterium]|nr:error-prone DNA polymerase [Alphaproteobacteria bacterium]
MSAASTEPSPPAYAELQCLTNFSFLEGASHADELVVQAAALGLTALGVADRNSLAGVVRAHSAAKKHGLRLLVGARLDLQDGISLLAYPTDRAVYARLSRLITLGRRRAEKGACHLYRADLREYAQGCVLILLPQEEVEDALQDEIAFYRGAFPGFVYLAASHALGGEDAARIAALDRAARRGGVPLVATNDVLMHTPARRPLADMLACIREKVVIDRAGWLTHKNGERHLKSPEAMTDLFEAYPHALAATVEVAARCRFSLDELAYEYPEEVLEDGLDAQASLERLTWEGAKTRYPGGLPAKVRAQVAHELRLIGELDYAPYFLTVQDIVRFARSQGILCQGRGSAANSAVCYCLGVTAVDPARLDLLFERFVSAERGEPPDIDVDFEHERREEVIQYIYDKYGRHRAGLAATVICYRARGAVRDVGKAMGLSQDVTALLSSQIWGWSNEGVDEAAMAEIGLDPRDRRLRQTIALVHQITGFPRHLSQHVGGFVITRGRLDELCPIENAAMADRTVVEWDKDDLDALGILKVDVLALGMLSCLRKGFDLLRRHYGRNYDLASTPPADKATYDMLCRADSLGVFQVESRAQMAFLPRMKPRDFYDLVIEVAIVRPGPIQGDMVHPYLRRRNGEEQVRFPSKELEDVLGKTLGVPLFQEQAMKIAIVAAGFEPSEADQLRRAMATFRKTGKIHEFNAKMVEGMVARGYERDFAERCFRQIEGFGEYGFPESHAASFALLVYVSAWMKCHYPAVFACALLNSQPMGFYAPAQIIRDAVEHGVDVKPIDVNHSEWDNILEAAPTSQSKGGYAIRLGFRQIKGLSQEDGEWIAAARGNGYAHPMDLWRRAGLKKRALHALAKSDAYGSLGLSRRQALWAVQALGGDRPLPLFEAMGEEERGEEPLVALPEPTLGEEVVQDYAHLRMSLKAHPCALLRDTLSPPEPDADGGRSGDIPAERLVQMADGAPVTVSGLVLVRQRPGSAKGVVFATLEDETAWSNIVIWSDAFEAFRRPILTARLMRVRGVLQRQGIVTHVVAREIIDISSHLDALASGVAGDPETRFAEIHAHADEVKRPVYVRASTGDRGGSARADKVDGMIAPAEIIAPDPHRGAGYRPIRTAAGTATPPPPLPKAIPRPRHPREQAKALFPEDPMRRG